MKYQVAKIVTQFSFAQALFSISFTARQTSCFIENERDEPLNHREPTCSNDRPKLRKFYRTFLALRENKNINEMKY